MKKREFDCDMCHIPMICIKTNKRRGVRGTYRERTFECPVCGNKEVIYADGGRDRPEAIEKPLIEYKSDYELENIVYDFKIENS